MSQSSSAHHEGVSCDGCMTPNFAGNRYKCLKCFDFDLCHVCYTDNRFNMAADRQELMHTVDHPMQCILSQRDFNLLYEGDHTKNYDTCKIVVFTCPYCNRAGFNHKTFLEHFTRDHPEPPNPPFNVICPLCVACPEFDANREVDNMKVHWTNFHSNFDPGTFRLTTDSARSASRRPMLARRTARQPAGNNQNPRRVAARTLSRLYAEVLQENANANAGNNGAGGQTAAAQAVAQFGLPWTSDLTDVDEMFRMVNMNRNLPPLPTNFPTVADVARLGTAQAQFQPLNTATTAPVIPTLRAATNRTVSGLYHPFGASGSSTNEYAAPSSSRGTAGRAGAVSSVQIMKSVDTTRIYPQVYDQYDDVLDLTEDENSSEDGEYESAEEGGDEKGTSNQKERAKSESDSEFQFEEESVENKDLAIDDELFVEEFKVTDHCDSYGSHFATSPIVDPTKVPNPIEELRRQLTDSEWQQVVRVAKEHSDEESEDEERAETPMAHLAGSSSHDEPLDPQCWLTVQLDTSQLSFVHPTQYWTDKRFLRQRKLQRDLSVSSDMQRCLEQTDVAQAALRAGVGFPCAGRELDSVSESVKAALKNVRYGHPEVTSINNAKEDILIAASRRLESESEIFELTSPPATSAQVRSVTVNTSTKPCVPEDDSDGETSEEEEENNVDFRPDEEYVIGIL